MYEKMMFAIMNGDIKPIQTFINEKNDVNIRDKAGRTLLMEACIFKREDTVKLLIEKGSNVNARDFYDNTPLQKAVFSSKSNGEIITLLLKAGADKNIVNKSGISPYQVALKITNFNIKQFFE
jgi:uncharacterized protein